MDLFVRFLFKFIIDELVCVFILFIVCQRVNTNNGYEKKLFGIKKIRILSFEVWEVGV